MATYKVIQDIEAEDKLVGPLSLRQFIYAGVAAVALYICFLSVSRGVSFLIVFFLPVALIGGFFGFPWKGEQPTEIWALARLRFMVKPRTRIWNQDGVKDLVTVMAPRNLPSKRPVRNLTQSEVESRLKALADTIDSRGWATRNANYQYYANQRQAQSDRLVNAGDLKPEAIPLDAFLPANDILNDESPVAKNLDALLNKSSQQTRQRVIQEMTQASQAPAPASPVSAAGQVIAPAGGASASSAGTAQIGAGLAGASGLQFQEVPIQNYNPAPSLPRPITPMTFNATAPVQAPQAQPTTNPYWFAGPTPGYPGAAVPANPTIAQPLVQPQTIQAVPAAPTAVAAPQPQTQPYQPVQITQPAPQPTAPGVLPTGPAPIQAANPTPEEQAMAQQLRANNQSTMDINYNHLRVMPAPTGVSLANAFGPGGPQLPQPIVSAPAAPVTRQPDPAILDLAKNDDLNVATLAREAGREVNKTAEGSHDLSDTSSGSSNGVEIPLR